MLISQKYSLLVLVLLSSVLFLLVAACILLGRKYAKYRSRPYLLSCFFFLMQICGISGVLLTSIYNGRSNAHFDSILKPESLIAGFITIAFLLAYIIEIKLPGKLTIKKSLLFLAPFLFVSAVLVLSNPTPICSLNELFNGLNRLDVWLRLIIVFFFVAYPIVVAFLPYEWRHCMVTKKTITLLHVLTCIVSPLFILGMSCGFFPAIFANYIIAIVVDSIIAYIELKMRIPASEPLPNRNSYLESDKLLILDSPEIWMNPDMTATELATILGTNHTYLLKIIKENGYSCYTDMINSKRVKFICESLRKRPDTNIISLMFEAGFRSRSTASREFKRIVGCAPSEYQKSIKHTSEEHPGSKRTA